MSEKAFNLDEYIMSHVLDGNEWHVPFLPTVHLPAFLSKHGVMIILCAALLIYLFTVVYRKRDKVPRGMTNFLEIIVLFVRNQIAIAYLGEKDGRRMAPFFCTLFFFILGLNLLGLVPTFSAATGNINVTAALALVTFCVMVFGAIWKNGIKGFMKALTPSGVPWPILILVIPLEFMGLFIKTFALTVRLFANMFAGHIIIFALLGLVVVVGYAALPAVLLALLVNVIEVGIAFLQAYIFTLLSAIFIGLIHHPEH